MRKLSFPVSMIALGAILLSACAGAAATGTAPTQGAGTGAGTTSTPVAVSTATTSAPTAGATAATAATAASTATVGTTAVAGTPAASATAGTGNATAAAPTTAVGTITVAPTTGASSATSAPTASTTGTPSASNNQSVTYVRLTDLLKMNVTGSDQAAIGTISSVVVDRPAVSASTSDGSASVSAQPVVIRYVVVNQTGGQTRQVLVPWQAFAFDQSGATANNGVLTLTSIPLSVSGQAISAAPAFDASASSMNTSGWDASVSSYWASQGLSIPTTGNGSTSGTRSDVLLDVQQLNNLKINGPDNQVLGQVSDFLINSRTGEIAYAMLQGGASLNNQSFVVPLTNLSWQGSTGVDLGSLVASFPNSILSNAPSLNGTTLPQDWATQVQNFWNSINK